MKSNKFLYEVIFPMIMTIDKIMGNKIKAGISALAFLSTLESGCAMHHPAQTEPQHVSSSVLLAYEKIKSSVARNSRIIYCENKTGALFEVTTFEPFSRSYFKRDGTPIESDASQDNFNEDKLKKYPATSCMILQ